MAQGQSQTRVLSIGESRALSPLPHRSRDKLKKRETNQKCNLLTHNSCSLFVDQSMAQTKLNPFNQSCWNCSTSIPQGTNVYQSQTGVLLTQNEAIILSVVCAVVSAIGTLGNSLVFLAVYNLKNHHKIPDLFIASLASSDISVCALYLPMMIFSLNHGARTDHYVIFYAAKRFLGHASMVASATNMFAVTVDRVIAIRFPFKYVNVMTTRNTLAGIVVIWLVALTYGALYARDFISTIYVSTHNLLMLFTTLIMYIYIFFAAKRQENIVQNMPVGPDAVAVEKKSSQNHFYCRGNLHLVLGTPISISSHCPSIEKPTFIKKRFSLD